MMGNSMRAGFSIIQSMELVGNEGPSPASEFERVVTEIRLGLPVDVALDHLLNRLPGEDLELMVVAINVQRQIGGNLSEILTVISETIRQRVQFEGELKTLTTQGRLVIHCYGPSSRRSSDHLFAGRAVRILPIHSDSGPHDARRVTHADRRRVLLLNRIANIEV
jgi:hypothetical protein